MFTYIIFYYILNDSVYLTSRGTDTRKTYITIKINKNKFDVFRNGFTFYKGSLLPTAKMFIPKDLERYKFLEKINVQ